MSKLHQYWGKAGQEHCDYHLLVYHCLDAAAVACELLSNRNHLLNVIAGASEMPRELTLALATFFIGLHDIGKFAPAFQSLRLDIREKLKGPTALRPYIHRHDYLACLVWNNLLIEKWFEGRWFGLEPTDIDEFDFSDIIRPWCVATSGHHGQPPDVKAIGGCDDSYIFQNEFGSNDLTAILILVEALQGLLSPKTGWEIDDDRYPQMVKAFKRTSWLVAGLCVLSDWLASNSTFFPMKSDVVKIEEYWLDARHLAKKAITEVGLGSKTVGKATGMSALFPNIGTPSDLQNFAGTTPIQEGPQLFIFEESTGSGKTEAALVLAHRIMAEGNAERLYIGLPTMATANAMYSRMAVAYQRLFESTDASLVLAHSARRFQREFLHSLIDSRHHAANSASSDNLESSAQCAQWLGDNNKKALLADVGVGTIDQALLGVLPVRHQSLRLLGLCGGVLIIDEVHAYDEYTRCLLMGLIEFQAAQGGSIILLSATLPERMRSDFIRSFLRGLNLDNDIRLTSTHYPLATVVRCRDISEDPLECRAGTDRTVSILWEAGIDRVFEKLIWTAESRGCACYIRNTVDDAMEAFERISYEYGPDKVMLFHARMALGDRLAVEEQCLKTFGKQSRAESRAGRILIATQVVEQSLDLDFDFMATDLAPMDLLIQRAGRLFRHARPDRPLALPELMVFGPHPDQDADANWYASFFPRAAYVYRLHSPLWRTADLLTQKKALRLPQESRELIETVFGEMNEESTPKSLLDRDLRLEGELRGAFDLAGLNRLKVDQGYELGNVPWREDTPTRLGEPINILQLYKWENGRLSPWAGGSDRLARYLSRVSVRQFKVDSIVSPNDPALVEAMDAETKQFLTNEHGVLPTPLIPDSNDSWTVRALDGKGREVTLKYNARSGLSFE